MNFTAMKVCQASVAFESRISVFRKQMNRSYYVKIRIITERIKYPKNIANKIALIIIIVFFILFLVLAIIYVVFFAKLVIDCIGTLPDICDALE